jgi:Tetratricopeptide repeat
LLRRGETDEALELLDSAKGDFVAGGLAARARLETSDELRPAFEAWDQGDHAEALERLQSALLDADADQRNQLRQVMVAIFTELGPDHELAREHRRRLSAALS